ncbi:sensor histidine kinase [Streptomyces naganishii]|uniref:Two-component sensor histidine kinase n=1 Tax=Streptomyces naganishii JCM 4654 TaxID=1306179 RepID=A0A919CSJ3_9ACTN|nr:sensor histidine kinase [Streptomyces naganishii]GHD83710.1 two-component sensor histidine kinase [Streptomyces naganishii JCM 4654]
MSGCEGTRADRRAWRAGKRDEHAGPPPTGFTLLPWLLMGLGSLSNVLQGKTPNPWVGVIGLLTFNSLYIYVVFRAFDKQRREAVSTRLALLLMGAVTTGLALGYGGNWLLFFPLLGLAAGAALRGPWLGRTGLLLTALAGAVSAYREGWNGINIAYGTFLSSMVTAAILGLSEAVRELRAAREELARRAVEEERLRFSRDLHDLLGHTLSVIVVKSEAARRLAPRDLDAALSQVNDIESVGRQALTEIREAVTGYREGSLSTELDRARSALTAAGIEPVVRRSGPPLTPRTEALLGWVVRESVTNAVRHSGATRCEIAVHSTADHARLTVSDNGGGRDGGAPEAGSAGAGGTGLKGLTERLAAAGGSLRAGPSPRGGFTVTAELPADQAESAETESVTATRAT